MALLLLWAASIGFTYWDASRRRLPTTELIAWVALAVVIPFIGSAAYGFYRLLGVLFSPAGASSEPPLRRATLLKRPPRPNAGTGTLLGADLAQRTNAAPRPASPQSVPNSSPGGQLFLKVIAGPTAGRDYLVSDLPIVIGRGPEAVIRLDEDLGVSRRHAEIYQQEGILRIRDLQSSHGTRLRGHSIQDAELTFGDPVEIGVTTLVVHPGERRK